MIGIEFWRMPHFTQIRPVEASQITSRVAFRQKYRCRLLMSLHQGALTTSWAFRLTRMETGREEIDPEQTPCSFGLCGDLFLYNGVLHADDSPTDKALADRSAGPHLSLRLKISEG